MKTLSRLAAAFIISAPLAGMVLQQAQAVTNTGPVSAQEAQPAWTADSVTALLQQIAGGQHPRLPNVADFEFIDPFSDFSDRVIQAVHHHEGLENAALDVFENILHTAKKGWFADDWSDDGHFFLAIRTETALKSIGTLGVTYKSVGVRAYEILKPYLNDSFEPFNGVAVNAIGTIGATQPAVAIRAIPALETVLVHRQSDDSAPEPQLRISDRLDATIAILTDARAGRCNLIDAPSSARMLGAIGDWQGVLRNSVFKATPKQAVQLGTEYRQLEAMKTNICPLAQRPASP